MECLIQSLGGVAFRDGRTFLLSPAERYSKAVVERDGYDAYGNEIRFEIFYCFVSRAIDRLFPGETDFEIFRLHYDTYRLMRPEDELRGELLSKGFLWWEGAPLEYNVGIEHLWGGYYADRQLLVDRLIQNRSHELLLRGGDIKAPSIKEINKMDLGYLPHPGMAPIWPDHFSAEIGKVERNLRRDAAQRVSIQ